MTINAEVLHNPIALRKAGLDVLRRELGPVGMIRFILQFNKGRGDYTKEREALFADVSVEEITEYLKETGE